MGKWVANQVYKVLGNPTSLLLYMYVANERVYKVEVDNGLLHTANLIQLRYKLAEADLYCRNLPTLSAYFAFYHWFINPVCTLKCMGFINYLQTIPLMEAIYLL